MVAGEKGLIRFEDVYQHAFEGTKYGRLEDEEFDVIINAIESVPKVDAVEVVHGRWKNVKETEVYSSDHRCTFTHTAKTCSACNVRIGFIGANFYLYDAYCPHCGAKMDGGESNGI